MKITFFVQPSTRYFSKDFYLDINKCEGCWEAIISNLRYAFCLLDDVIVSEKYVTVLNMNGQMMFDINNIENDTDVLIISMCSDAWNGIDWNYIRQNTSIKKIITVSECSYNWRDKYNQPDWGFVFLKQLVNQTSTHIPFPCRKDICENVQKNKVVVMDHYYTHNFGNGPIDWTFRISDWLEDIKDRYEIRRMVHINGEEIHVKQHEKSLIKCSIGEYYAKTQDAETYIITHQESFGYSVIDMLARGIRVISPPNFLNAEFNSTFKIPIFTNKEEMLNIITSELDLYWNTCIDQCTDYIEIANIIYQKLLTL